MLASKRFILLIIILLSCVSVLIAQTKNEVRTFQFFQQDAATSENVYAQGSFAFANLTGGSIIGLGADIGVPINSQLEVLASLTFNSLSIDGGDGRSGINDIPVYVRYHLPSDQFNITAGGFVTLPVGSEDIGGGDFDFGGFGSIRHNVNDQITILGTAELQLYELGSERETALRFGGGAIYTLQENVNLIGELAFGTNNTGSNLSAGIDFGSGTNGHFRGAIALGLDDFAPDFQILGSYVIFFNN